MNKWDRLRHLIKEEKKELEAKGSLGDETYHLRVVLSWMDFLDSEEKRKGFLFTDIPSFDQNTFDKILEEKGLQGLS